MRGAHPLSAAPGADRSGRRTPGVLTLALTATAVGCGAFGVAVAILLGHRPDTVLALPEGSRVDLTVAGHTHGGQVVLPLLGPLLTFSDVPGAVARGGLHQVDRNPIHVSPGVGLEREQAPQVRFLSRPAVGIVALRDA